MKLKSIVQHCLCLLAAVTTSVGAQCARVEAGQAVRLSDSVNAMLAPATATRLVAYLPNAANPNQIGTEIASMAATGNQAATPTAAFVQSAEKGVSAGQRGAYQLAFVDANNVPQGTRPFFLVPSENDAAKQAAACGTAAPPSAGAGLPAGRAECAAVAKRENLIGRVYESWILFNSTGALCFAPYPLRQKDRLNFAVVWRKDETMRAGATASLTNCSTPTAQPSIYAPSEIPGSLKLQSGTVAPVAQRDELEPIGTTIACASDSPTVTISIPQEGGKAVSRDQTLRLFARYNAVFHVGVLQSKLHKTDYRVENSVIVNKEPEDRGPEYMAMVVIQALPKALRGFSPGTPSYQGRDLVNDNDAEDRLGLAMAFGIQEPGSRFGLGLSYELARGVNVVAIHEWVKRTRLNGVSVGDTFTGTDLPTRKQWDKGWSLGLTLDIDYITKVFGAAGK